MPLALAVSFRAPVGGAKKTQTKPIRRGGVVAPVAVLASDKCVALTAPNDARAISRRRARHARIQPASWSPVALSTRPRASPRRDADSARETWLRYHRFETPTADPTPARFDRNPTGARPTPRRSSPRSAPPSPVRDRHPPPHPASHEIDASFPLEKKKTDDEKANDDSQTAMSCICFFPFRRDDETRFAFASYASSRTVRERLPPRGYLNK
jgi:hypothetical protein